MTRARVLFVDDEVALLEAMARSFHRTYDVLTATSGAAALALLAADSAIDVVVSDLRMPSMDGVALVGQVFDRMPELPCILLSGSPSDEPRPACVNVFQYVEKPCKRRDLQTAIDAAVARSRGPT